MMFLIFQSKVISLFGLFVATVDTKVYGISEAVFIRDASLLLLVKLNRNIIHMLTRRLLSRSTCQCP